jgi:hypothetical protein
MKRINAIALFTIVTLTAATQLVAQEPAVKANIPFNFTAGQKSMPAGEYTISSPDTHVLKIQSAGGGLCGVRNCHSEFPRVVSRQRIGIR